MSDLLKQEGFRIAMITTIGKWFTFKYIFKVLNRSTHVGFFGHLSSLFSRGIFSRLSIPLNLHDNMFVVAVKK
jgi:hypothetical protein